LGTDVVFLTAMMMVATIMDMPISVAVVVAVAVAVAVADADLAMTIKTLVNVAAAPPAVSVMKMTPTLAALAGSQAQEALPGAGVQSRRKVPVEGSAVEAVVASASVSETLVNAGTVALAVSPIPVPRVVATMVVSVAAEAVAVAVAYASNFKIRASAAGVITAASATMLEALMTITPMIMTRWT
jgi:hypothetical protein